MPVWSCPKCGGDYPLICYRDPNEGSCVCEDCGHVSVDPLDDGQWLTLDQKHFRNNREEADQ